MSLPPPAASIERPVERSLRFHPRVVTAVASRVLLLEDSETAAIFVAAAAPAPRCWLLLLQLSIFVAVAVLLLTLLLLPVVD